MSKRKEIVLVCYNDGGEARGEIPPSWEIHYEDEPEADPTHYVEEGEVLALDGYDNSMCLEVDGVEEHMYYTVWEIYDRDWVEENQPDAYDPKTDRADVCDDCYAASATVSVMPLGTADELEPITAAWLRDHFNLDQYLYEEDVASVEQLAEEWDEA